MGPVRGQALTGLMQYVWQRGGVLEDAVRLDSTIAIHEYCK